MQKTKSKSKPKASKRRAVVSAQQTIPYVAMHPDGICQLPGGLYTKTVEYEDINYAVASTEDQTAIFGGWSSFLNYFDSSLPFQLSFVNRRSRSVSRYKVNIPAQQDAFNSIRGEFVDMLKGQIAKSNNGIVRSKYITFGLPAGSAAEARPRLDRVEADVMGNFKRLGVQSRPLDGRDRLAALHGQLHPGSREPFRFSWKDIPKTGMGTKDFIAPDSFDFRQSRTFRVGQSWGAVSYLQILASEMSDKLLAEILELDAELTVTLHVQTVDQLKAIKTIKGKISDIGRMKAEEQKKAVRAGYDMEILPPDLITFSKDAAELLADLQSRNERMFLLTFTVVNLAPSRQRLENDVFTVSGIAQKYNCALKRLDWQQEQGFVSSLVLGYNGIEIQRGMTTSSTAIFIPFMTRELRMDGQALYYGMNALSHNVIMADRKKLKSANGMYLGSTGSGKSFAAKRELINVFLATSDRIVVVDPMGEYAPLVRRLGGQVIEIAPDSPNHINPMDIQLSTNDEDSPLSMKADFLLSLCELIVGGKEGLQPIEKTVIDRCVRLVYRELALGIGSGDMPLLQDLYEELLKQPEPEARRVATALELYCTGSLIHNHIYYNSTSLDHTRKFRDFIGSARAVRRLSDRVCLENDLSVILNPKLHSKGRFLHYGAWLGAERQPSYKERLRLAINDTLAKGPADFADFLRLMAESGYAVKHGRGGVISFLVPGQERATRLRASTLGDGYDPEDIRAVIAGKRPVPQIHGSAAPAPRRVNLIVDIQERLRSGKGPAYERWAKVYNLKQMAAALMFLQEHQLTEYDQLAAQADGAAQRFHALAGELRQTEADLSKTSALMEAVVQYAKSRPVFEGYKAARYSKKYLAEHGPELADYRAAKAALNELLDGEKLPKMDALKEKRRKLAARKKALYAEYRAAQQEMREAVAVKANIDHLLGLSDERKNKEQER